MKRDNKEISIAALVKEADANRKALSDPWAIGEIRQYKGTVYVRVDEDVVIPQRLASSLEHLEMEIQRVLDWPVGTDRVKISQKARRLKELDERKQFTLATALNANIASQLHSKNTVASASAKKPPKCGRCGFQAETWAEATQHTGKHAVEA